MIFYFRNFKKNLLDSGTVQSYPGFTLVEILIVIVIVGIIGTLAVSTYAAGRRQAKLEVVVDSLVSSLKEQLGKTKSGQRLSDGKPACFGIVLAIPHTIQALTNPYVVSHADGRADFCDISSSTLALDFLSDLAIQEIVVNDQTSYNQLTVLYKPPFGKLVFVDSSNVVIPEAVTLKVVLGLKSSGQKRCFSLDVRTGLIIRPLPAHC